MLTTIATMEWYKDCCLFVFWLAKCKCNLCFQTNLGIDYDPSNITHHSRHLCMDERRNFTPSYDQSPKLLDYTIPPEYVVSLSCNNLVSVFVFGVKVSAL